MTLADAAIEGTMELLKSVDSNARLRIFYVLNTDGEASDGVEAATSFRRRFGLIMEAYPNMLPPRTFMLGIGKDHDQGVLGAMSVGESSYYNFPDAELQGMVDIVPSILAELSCSTSAIKIKLHPSGIEHNINPTGDGNLILSGLEVAEGDTSITLPNGEVFPLEIQPIDCTHPSYRNLTLRLIKKNTLDLITQIKSFTTATGNKGPMLRLFTNKLTALKERYQNLSVVPIPQASVVSEGSIETRSLDEIIVSQGQDLNWKKQLTTKLKQSLKPKESLPPSSDEQNATTVAFKLCESCLECLRLGTRLSTELERDCMEILGSGGYEHFTSKQLKKLCVRAAKQINPDSMEDIDAKVTAYSNRTPKVTISDDRAVECWWTGESAQELAESEDVPVLVGYFPPGERNRGMSSVNSCLVIDQALISGRIHVCLQPMSFKTIRGLLCQGKQISRGPDGKAINLIISFMPDLSSEKSVVLAKMMSSLAASQLVTTNFNSTVGTMEFKNAVMTCVLAITSDHPFSELSCGTLTRAVESFYCYNFGIKYLKETLHRGANFLNGAITTGDVSTFQLAIVDQMLLLAHQRIGQRTSEVMKSVRLNETNNVFDVVCPGPVAHNFWRELFFRILRDEMDVCFTAFCVRGDPLADVKRSNKQKEADLFVQILAEGLNCEDMTSEFTFQSSVSCCVASVSNTCQSINEKIEFDDYFEETDADEVPPEYVLLPPKPPLEIKDMSFKEIIQHVVQQHPTLPLRHPDQPTSVCHLDEIRGQILEKLLARLQTKTTFMIKCFNYIQHQNALTFGDNAKFVKADSLFEILGLANDSSAWEYVLEKLLLAVIYRTNSSYKKDKDDDKSTLNLPAFTVVETLSKQFSTKRRLEWETLRNDRINGLKNIFSKKLRQHPKKLALLPLRVCGEVHFGKLKEWVLENRRFTIEQSLHPQTQTPTGMAKNTFMFPFSDFFMIEIIGSLACDNVYGSKKERGEFGFLEHLHTAVTELYEALETTDDNEETTAYAKFESLFYGKFGDDVDAVIPFELYTSLRVSQELESAPESELGSVVTSLLNDYPEGLHEKVANVISREFLWQVSPADYLNNYFAEEPKRVKLTFEEFTDYLGLKETQVDEMEAARLAFDQPIVLSKPKNKNKSAGMVNDGTTKEERKALKAQRRLDRNSA